MQVRQLVKAVILFLLSIAALSNRGSAAIVSRSVSQNAIEAQVIVVGRLVSFVAKAERSNDASGTFLVGRAPIIYTSDRAAGMNTIAVELRLKGDCPNTISFQTKPIHFSNYSAAQVNLSEGGLFLIFLSRDGDSWTPTDEARPLVPIGTALQTAELLPSNRSSDAADNVVRILIAALGDKNLRASILHVLSGTRSDAVVAAARHFMDDQDLIVRRNALKCLATNQIVEAIPRIADLARKSLAGGAIDALAVYEVQQAIPHLNPLLVDPASEQLRLRTMMAMRAHRLADTTSIPYLIVALRDNDRQGLISNFAYQAIHELVPTLGPWKEPAHFQAHRGEEIKMIEEWWETEGAAKYKPTTRPAQ